MRITSSTSMDSDPRARNSGTNTSVPSKRIGTGHVSIKPETENLVPLHGFLAPRSESIEVGLGHEHEHEYGGFELGHRGPKHLLRGLGPDFDGPEHGPDGPRPWP